MVFWGCLSNAPQQSRRRRQRPSRLPSANHPRYRTPSLVLASPTIRIRLRLAHLALSSSTIRFKRLKIASRNQRKANGERMESTQRGVHL